MTWKGETCDRGFPIVSLPRSPHVHHINRCRVLVYVTRMKEMILRPLVHRKKNHPSPFLSCPIFKLSIRVVYRIPNLNRPHSIVMQHASPEPRCRWSCDKPQLWKPLFDFAACKSLKSNQSFVFLGLRIGPPIIFFHSSSTVCFSINDFAFHARSCSSSASLHNFISLPSHSEL